MSAFQFYLGQFKITDTRSFRDDTLIAGLGAAVNGTVVGTQVAQLGSFDNGTYGFWEHKLGSIDNIVVSPTEILSIVFELYNNGHNHYPNQTQLTSAIEQDLQSYYKQSYIAATSRSPQDSELWSDGNFKDEVSSAFWTGGLYEIFKGIFGGCDGIVAGFAASILGQDLENSIDSAPGKVLNLSTRFNANDSYYQKPCNPSGSNYIVSWIIQHQP